MKPQTVSQVLALAFSAIITPAAAGHGTSVWTVNCKPLTRYRADPILNPGAASGHVHDVVGGTAFQRTMNGTTSMNSKNTTCDKYTDHSNYWVPSLYYAPGNGSLKLLPFLGTGFYYKNYTCDYDGTSTTGYCPDVGPARAFPPGFKMVIGNSTRRTYNSAAYDQGALTFTVPGYNDHVGIPPNFTGSTGSGNFQGNVQFPSCWDGVNLYLPNSAHVAYPNSSWWTADRSGGMCPSTHPKALISIGAEFYWDARTVDTTNGSQFVFANGDTTGYGFHGDFFQGWQNQTALQNSFANCFNNTYCPWRAFGTPDGKDGAQIPMNPEVPAVYEQPIGLNGPISYLPGDTQTSNCVSNCTIRQPYCC